MEEHREDLFSRLLPQVGMEFTDVDEAWMFWIRYGGQMGFEVRKLYTNKRTDGKVRSCRYVCANEGHRRPDKRDHLTKCPRAETRTDYQVCMGPVMDKSKGNYKVTNLILEHNHTLQLPQTSHLMASQRKISELQGFEIETTDDAGIGPKAAHELACIQVGGSANLSYTLQDHKNYLRGKRQREMAYGQASKLYTPNIFEAFQGEYERSMVACTTALEGTNEYLVAIGSLDENFTFDKEYKVIGDPLKQSSTCNCGQFNRIGILCGHALKVLDLMNIKLLPTQYVLKSWTREARSGTVQDNQGRDIIENPKLDEMLHYKDMNRKFLNLSHRAASYPKCILLVNNTLDMLSRQIEEEIKGVTSQIDPIMAPTNVSPPNELLSTASLKKKEVETKTSKRKKSWNEKFTKKGGNKKGKSSKVCDKKKEKISKEQHTTKVAVEDGATLQNACLNLTSLPGEEISESYTAINSFSQLLKGAMSDSGIGEFGEF